MTDCVNWMGNFTAFCSDGPCATNVVSGTQVCWTGDGVCQPGDPEFKLVPNGACEVLSDEFTTGDLVYFTTLALPSYPGTWDGDCSAIRDLAVDELSYSIQRFKYKFQLPDMAGNTTAQITWKERFTPDGGGSPVDTPKVYNWDGVASETGEFTVNEPTSNGTVSIVEVEMTCT